MTTAFGFDLNGLWDFAAASDGEPDSKPVLKDLGIRGSIIRLASGKAKAARWIGGPQAALAPHGRGPGWGEEIGGAENRVFWADVLNAVAADALTDTQAEAVRVFLDGLVDRPSTAHVAVPDAGSFDEHARDRLLRLLSRTRRLRATLLWRPIAAILGWLEAPADSRHFQPSPDMRIGVLSLMGGGIQFADARLIREDWRGGDLWVPERSTAGLEVQQGFGGDMVAARHRHNIAAELCDVDQATLSVANAPWRAAVGDRRVFELIRLPNRSWRRVPDGTMPAIAISQSDVPGAFRAAVKAAEALIIEGPMAGNAAWVDTLLQAIGVPGVPAHRAKKGLVAEGGLAAALRTAAGAPVYYDFLPQLEINALVGGEPRFVDLVPKHTRLLGGSVYRRAAPGEFSIGKGATRPVFFLFKQDFPKGRMAEVDLPEEADREHRITVTVEQTPGQGLAQVRVSSDTFEAIRRQPIELNWSAMKEVDTSKEEILDSLRGQGGLAWPDAVATPGHPFLWHPDHPNGDLRDRLQAYLNLPLLHSGSVNLDARNALMALRERFSKPETPSYLARQMRLVCPEQGRFRALDSNGQLPEARGEFEVPPDAERLLDAALEKAGRELALVLAHRSFRYDEKLVGDIVGFCSWCFWRCPGSVIDCLVKKYSGMSDMPINHILLREGLGRVVHTPEHIVAYFRAVDKNLKKERKLSSSEFAALGRLLGTSAEAAELLLPATADLMLQQTSDEIAGENFKSSNTAFKKKFKAALLMLAALLRHRRLRTTFIDPQDGAIGELLVSLLAESSARNEQFRLEAKRLQRRSFRAQGAKHAAAARRFERNAEILCELIAMINRKGSDPNIIRKIDEMEDTED